MGEYTWTIMTIGGKASTKVIEEDLVEAVGENFSSGDGQGELIFDMIADALGRKTNVTFQGERNFGCADELEAFCQEHGFSYHLSWSAVPGQFDAGLKYWSPGMEDAKEEGANDDGEPIITLSWLKGQEHAGRTIEEVIAEMSPACCSNVPALEADDLISRMEGEAA